MSVIELAVKHLMKKYLYRNEVLQYWKSQQKFERADVLQSRDTEAKKKSVLLLCDEKRNLNFSVTLTELLTLCPK